MNSSQEEEKQPVPVRIIQVDRKLANQLGDVSMDLKVLLVKEIKERMKLKPISPTQHQS